MTEEIKNHTGIIGYLTEVEYAEKDSVLVFQLPRSSNMISQTYAQEIRNSIKQIIPGRDVLIIPGDVNIFEIAGEDMLALKLKGIV
jgi:hypothetical protein